MSSGPAERWGELWGARADAWAEQEWRNAPVYEEALRRLPLPAGARVLDVGCGAGSFLRLASAAGAVVHGLDASAALLEVARRRVPEAELRRGDLARLPYEADAFDAVTGFNSFQFADTRVALVEAARVTRPGGRVLVLVWGRPERCELLQAMRALAPLRAHAPAPAGLPLAKPGVLEELAASAGLAPGEADDFATSFEWPDAESMLRGLCAAANAVDAVRTSGEEAVRAALLDAMAPYADARGGYRVVNEWHVLVAEA